MVGPPQRQALEEAKTKEAKARLQGQSASMAEEIANEAVRF